MWLLLEWTLDGKRTKKPHFSKYNFLADASQGAQCVATQIDARHRRSMTALQSACKVTIVNVIWWNYVDFQTRSAVKWGEKMSGDDPFFAFIDDQYQSISFSFALSAVSYTWIDNIARLFAASDRDCTLVFRKRGLWDYQFESRCAVRCIT